MTTAGSAGREARQAARKVAGSPVVNRLARVGLACRGVLYALIGVLAVQIALGDGGQEADKGGAITTLAALPFGAVLLWIMVVGFAALALWQATEAVFGGREALQRAESVARAVVYVLIFITLLTVLSAGRAASEDEKSRDVTGKLLDLPGGQLIVGAIGLGLLALGVYWVRQGITRKFREELNLGQMSARARTWMERLGVAGYVARGLIAGLAGIFVVQAAITYDPGKAGGIDATLRAFADTPAGPWLLVLVAAGLVLFAGYCFGEARWRRT
ncbi:DUF1206 domain-containing protein [Bailinhaonella thermotolerans]|uniref:DUF1206 domain-containing protein n=1 Tax=Bailinhaonella thermotolerans TaxID=1070861 RepID=A0A3A4AVR4_9ACTN|nr:DUF1206 domain-containing protein [Bailinhaonella thermotolerans]RJL30147.1 DUF1206 domain-containing protein [Bailinhaonella thermotolerans]